MVKTDQNKDHSENTSFWGFFAQHFLNHFLSSCSLSKAVISNPSTTDTADIITAVQTGSGGKTFGS